ncbi:hypothetical protein ACEUZ9_001073 [Paracoccus litorisediminis]|uniref:DUF7933 domain-containing protein n=1 Tax=Paracoccus litorisediminis TaxID=2006130 RepID=UPI003733CE7D
MTTPALAQIEANISFSPSAINAGTTSRATFTLQNSGISPGNSAAISVPLPDGLLLQGGGAMNNSCGGTVHFTSAGEAVLNLTNGIIPPAVGAVPGTCAISFDATAHRAATLTVSVAAGSLSANVGGVEHSNVTPAQASLTATMVPLKLNVSSSFNDEFQGGEIGWRNFKIANPNAVAVTGLDFPIDTSLFGTYFNVLDLISNSCGGSYTFATLSTAFNANYDNNTLGHLVGGTIAAKGTCDLRVKLIPTRKLGVAYAWLGQTNSISGGIITTDQGVTNTISSFFHHKSVSGKWVDLLVNGQPTAAIDAAAGEVAEITYELTNHNVIPTPGISLKVNIPSALEIVSLDGGSCGSLSKVSGGVQFSLTSPGAPDQVAGHSGSKCIARIFVRALTGGSYNVYTTAGNFGTAPYGATYIPGDSITIGANSSSLDITGSFDQAEFYASDHAIFTLRLDNKSPSATLSDISVTNNISAHLYGAILDNGGIISNSCDAKLTVPSDQSSVTLSGFSLAPNASCDISYRIRFGSSAYNALRTDANPITKTNKILANDASYELAAGGRQIWGSVMAAETTIRPSILTATTYSPSPTQEGGISRLQFNLTKRSNQGHDLKDIWINIPLPSGVLIAPQPNFSTTCPGAVFGSSPGDVSFRASDGTLNLAVGQESASCSLFVDVILPLLLDGETMKVFSSRIEHDMVGSTRRNYGAQDSDLAGDPGKSYISWAKILSLQVGKFNLDLGLAFADASLGGSGSTRVSVILSNAANTSLVLSGVHLPIDLSTSGVKLAAAPNPNFTAVSGAASRCSGAKFTAIPGTSSIALESASIAAGAECRFEFTVAASQGGNHVISIPAKTVVSSTGVTNASGVYATVTVGAMLSGGIGFTPNLIEEGGIADIAIEVLNTMSAGNDYAGASTAISFTLPGYLVAAGIPTTTCSEGTAGLTGNTVYLSGGSFQGGGTCKLSLPVRIAISGEYSADLAAGAIQTTTGVTNTSASTSKITVLKSPVMTLSSTSAMTGTGRIGSAVISLRNPNTAALNPAGLAGLAFSGEPTSSLSLVESAVASTCSGFNYTLGSDDAFAVSGISLLPGASCTVTVGLTSDLSGDHGIRIGSLALTDFALSSPADIDATLRFASNPIVTMRPTGPAPDSEIPFHYEVDIANANDFAVGLTSFSLPLPVIPSALTISGGAAAIDCGAAVLTAPSAASSVTLTSGSLPASGSCRLGLDLVAPKAGIYALIPSMALQYGTVDISPVSLTILGSAVSLQAQREIRVLADQVSDTAACAALDPSSSGAHVLPGACVEIIITIENPAVENKIARHIAAREILGPELSLASFSAGDFDSLTEDDTNLIANLAALAPGDAKSFSYRAVLN